MGIITLSRQLTAMQLTRLDLPLDWTEQPARELNGSAKAQPRPRADPCGNAIVGSKACCLLSFRSACDGAGVSFRDR
jgi:hypothetical protein